MTLLRVRNLVKHFPIVSGIMRRVTGYVQALAGIDIDVGEGEVVGIVGETGSGKSTLARAVLKLTEPTAGTIFFNNRDIASLDPRQLKEFRKEAQMVFQDPYASLNPRKRVCDSIGESLRFLGIVKTRREQYERVAAILELVGLHPDAMWRYPHQFSGGQQQRICIGRAMAVHPRLIVCDEALSALDVSVQAQVLNVLQELKQKFSLSYLFISHDLSSIKYLCDNVVILYLGKIMEKGSTEEIFRNPRHPYTQALLSAIPPRYPSEKRARMLLKGDIPSPIHPPSGCPFRTRCPFAQPICAEIPPKKILRDPTTGKDNHEYHCIL